MSAPGDPDTLARLRAISAAYTRREISLGQWTRLTEAVLNDNETDHDGTGQQQADAGTAGGGRG